MKTKFTIILFCSLIILSCSNNRIAEEEIISHNETPKALDEAKSDFRMSSISKRFDSDIIDKLYTEAISKDPELKELTEQFEEIEKLQDDSLVAYNKYSYNNKQYWTSVDYYLNRLSDTILENDVRNTFDMFKANYEKKISILSAAFGELEARKKLLNDQKILMKLFVTMPMMQNYQRNEIPNMNTILDLNSRYDTLINKSKPYIKLN